MRAALLALAACRIGFDPSAGGDGGANDGDGESDGRVKVAAGNDHTCVIRGTALFCFGGGGSGQLGQGNAMDQVLPVQVPGAWIDVAAGDSHTCAVDTLGMLFCWGGNSRGEVGVGDVSPRNLPAPVTLPSPARYIDATSFHTCAVLEDGSLMAWGENSEGQLGQGNVGIEVLPVAMSTRKTWTTVACGYAHTIGSEGAISGTGRNTGHQLGLGDTAMMQYRSLTAIDPGPWDVITGGQDLSCGIRSGDLYCWGLNTAMQLGTGDATQRTTPFAIDTTEPWVDVEVDTFGGCALAEDGEAWCWGRNVEGQLGTGDFVDYSVPTRTGSKWKSIAVGRFHACGERRDGTFWCTGQGRSGRLGNGLTGNTPSWTQVMLPAT